MKEEDRVKYMRELAERFFLSYEMVVSARLVFDTHRRLDTATQAQPPRASTQTPEVDAGAAEAASDFQGSMEGVETAPQGELAVRRKLSMDSDAPVAAPIDPSRGLVAVRVTDVDEGENTAVEAGVPVGHHLRASLAVPPTYVVPWEGDERIGVVGLEAALSQMGCSLSRLEVTDLIDAVHGRVPLLDTALRAVQEEEVHTQEERQWQQQVALEASSSRSGRRSRAASVSSAHSSASPSRGSPASARRLKSGKSTKDSVSLAPGETRPSHRNVRGGTCDAEAGGLTFAEFLHVLQLPLVPEDESPATREAMFTALFDRLDHDRDGVLSEADIIAALRTLIYDEHVLANDATIQQLAMMYPAELQTALAECDVDGDGIVTLSDLSAVLR